MNRLLAGAAKLDITPLRLGLRLGGHGVNRCAVGVRDPLLARVVAISDGSAPLVIAALDLVGLMRGYVQRIRDRVPAADPRRIWVCSTHTHDSPDTLGFFGPMIAGLPLRSGLDEEYQEYVVDRTAAAVREAIAALRPARLIAAAVRAPAMGLTRNVRLAGLKDNEIQIMRFEEPGGKPIALCYHYACHPEFLGHTNRLISAEWPGVTNSLLESRFGGVALLVQNALGGMVTGAVSRDDGSFDPVIGQPFVAQLGRRIADLVVAGLNDNGRETAVDEIRTAHQSFDVQVENKVFYLASRLNILPRWMIDAKRRTVTTEVNVGRLGPIALATVPGEALPEVGFAVKRLLAAPHPWVLNLACDELGYLLPVAAWNDPNYWYERSMSVGGGAVPLIEDTLKLLLARLRE
ncbi:MAG: hypothetical protein GX444_14090 [Myxococcales bacterium]|nr:hypothetical protein [Myxococcales bacterium]